MDTADTVGTASTAGTAGTAVVADTTGALGTAGTAGASAAMGTADTVSGANAMSGTGGTAGTAVLLGTEITVGTAGAVDTAGTAGVADTTGAAVAMGTTVAMGTAATTGMADTADTADTAGTADAAGTADTPDAVRGTAAMSGAAVSRKKKSAKKSAWSVFKKNLPLTLLALPTVAVVFVINYLPLYGLILPFKNFKVNKGFWGSDWVGFDNFKFLFAGDTILSVTRNTVLYNLTFIVVGTGLSVFVALLLFELTKKPTTVYQTILFVPYFVSWVVVSYSMMALLDADHGVFNKIVQFFGGDRVLWYNVPSKWPLIILAVAVWKGLGYSSVMFYAALMGVNHEYYEAATIDGVNKFQQAVHISVPLIKNIIVIVVILQIGKIFYGDFGLFYSVPLDSPMLYSTTDVIDTFVYRALRKLGDIGMASAAGFYQSMVGFILVMITNAVVSKVSEENALF
jgi:putative aldouronate transport system permease protein